MQELQIRYLTRRDDRARSIMHLGPNVFAEKSNGN